MKMNTLAKVATKNEHARILLEDLKAELACVRKELKARRKKQLMEENNLLTRDINGALSSLIKLETLRGRKQISLPSPECKEHVKVLHQKDKESIEKKPVETREPEKRTANLKGASDTPKAKKSQESSTKDVADVSRLDFRVGKIVEVTRHPEADSLYLEKIDCGESSPRTVISGLVKFIPIEEMKDRMVIVLCNLKPAKMRGITSEAMVMCASTPEKVEVLTPPPGAVPGDLVHCEGYERNPDLMLNPKKKIFETCAPDLLINDYLSFCYKGKPLIVPQKGEIKSQTLKNVQVK